MRFVFTNPDRIADEPELQSANLNMDKKGDTLSEIEAPSVRQRHEPRDFKDLTGHAFSTIPPDFKPVLTIPWTERPDQGISNFPADLTIIERFTTVTQSEQSVTTSIPRRLTPGTEIETVTIIDRTKFIPPSSTSDITSSKETTTDVPSLSTEKTLLASSSYKSSEESSWTTSYTTGLSTGIPPPPPTTPSETPALSDTTRIVIGVAAGVFSLLAAIYIIILVRRWVKRPQPRHEEPHGLQPVPRPVPSTNVAVTVTQNHVGAQPQQPVPDYGWKV
ncbi:hypothetical protein FGADI_10371 [Fusarium gaditjirri]|uniref:Mid2 domain-containing protein n=1 Tax=Fusarium gaditjirri TaxID=282569 RepID=A0A8H4WRR0_9HYPO|nr:hypothetical protein FGADI_10371 [Fusarium gaditjirri]